jgi:hypothetical protein
LNEGQFDDSNDHRVGDPRRFGWDASTAMINPLTPSPLVP